MSKFDEVKMRNLMSNELLDKLQSFNEAEKVHNDDPIKKYLLAFNQVSLQSYTLDLARIVIMIFELFGDMDQADVCGNAADTL